ncbi:carboxypeptidase regulatory-like domain-containing protein [Streptomyces sp. NPDC002265]|uniref:carboxypeptidase regulatory-like domain-containing protein n=1 Tax=Streptomyces sp. NPDC002265 TaxID=3154415 RepID=UPI003318EB20
MTRRGRLRAPVSFLIAACLGLFAAAQVPAVAAGPATGSHKPTAAVPAEVARQAEKDAAAARQDTKPSLAKISGRVHRYAPADCNTPTPKKHTASCQALVRTTSDQRVMVRAAGPSSTALSPADIQSAYHLPATGQGQTVAIVDAYGYADAEADLGKYREQFGLPACTTQNGCFRKTDQQGGTNYPPDDKGWSLETALDLDAVSAACPACHILLVQADSANVGDLGTAVNTAVKLGAKFVSNSYGLADAHASDLSGADFDHPGVVVTASSGDTGNEVIWPSSDPNVVATGGTLLTRAPGTARGWTESAWSGAGSGCSTFEPQPDYQSGSATNCPRRATADISAVADPQSGLAVYNSLNDGWLQVGGTSLSSPLIAAMYALAGTPVADTYPVTYPYAHQTKGLFDITEGVNGACGDVLCEAGPGWDGPTGLGTPDGVSALVQGPSGVVSGRVTDLATGTPLAGVAVTLTDKPDQFLSHATTDSTGAYRVTVPAGTYDVSASLFGYGTGTRSGIGVTADHTAAADMALTKTPSHRVSGTVTDASGHGWPLYARITIDGYPSGALYTDAKTGAYSVDLPEQADYTMHLTPVYPGYQTSDSTIKIGAADVTHDIAVAADLEQCTAPGFAYPAQASFEGWTKQPKYGWTVTNKDPSAHGWEFDGEWNLIGDAGFAVANPYGTGGGAQDTSLISPPFDLTDRKSADLRFNALSLLPSGSEADVSVTTDGGATWSRVYQGEDNFYGHVEVPLTQAVGHRKVQVRFHFSGDGQSIFEMSGVSVGQCRTLGGGLIQGSVSDANTGQPIDGATVKATSADAADMHATAVSTATPNDPGLPDGFYWLYSSKTGQNTLTTTAARYTTAKATVTASDTVHTYHPALQAGRLKVTRGKVSLNTALGGKASQDITLTNTGHAPLKVTVAEQSATTSEATEPTAADGSWHTLPDHPEPVRGSVVGSYRGKTYSVGGMDKLWGGHVLGHGYVYDPAARSWSRIADLPQPRNSATGAFVNGTLYVAGGFGYDASGTVGWTPTTYAYHPDSDSWSRVADLPQALADAAVAVLDGKLYVIGGVTADGSSSPAVYRYDPARNTWNRIADYPIAMSAGGCGGIDGGIVCAGGLSEVHGPVTPLAHTYIYHAKRDTWTRAADMPYFQLRASYSSANGRLQVVGGMDSPPSGWAAMTHRALQYDPVADVWTDLPSAPAAVADAGHGTGCGLFQIGGTADEFGVSTTTGAAMLAGLDQCGGDDVGWLSQNRTTVTLKPGHSTRLRVTADAKVLAAPGRYAATLSMITDTPYVYQPVRVTLKATAPASWAEISGKVTDATTGKLLPGATVALSHAGRHLITVTTDSHGVYDVWLKETTPTITVTSDGYNKRSREVSVKRGSLTKADFALPSS